jgi:chromate transporter
MSQWPRLRELASYFLRLGLTAFGGPAAHIALMEEDCVRRRGWITRERFLDVLGAANLIPGPTSTELAMHIGHARAGLPGLIVGGTCFILPAACLVGILAAVYVEAGALPRLGGMLRLVKPVVVGVVAIAVLNLTRGLRRSWSAAAAGAAGCLAAMLGLAGINEALAIVVAGAANAIAARVRWPVALSVVPLADVFLYFVRAGSLVFGSGYVLLPILRGDLVDGRQWISEGQLLDAIAIGHVTPGPVFTAATFIGYVVAGPAGAVVATIGIFLPAFVFSTVSVRLLDRVRREGAARAFLDGVNAAAIALIAVTLLGLGRGAIVDTLTAVAAVAAVVLVGWLGLNAAWVILAAAALGLFL